MEKTDDKRAHRPPSPRPGHGRVQPFSRPGFPDPGLTSHSVQGGGSANGEHGESLGHRRRSRAGLADIKEPYGHKRVQRRPAPPEQTSAEAFYYIKQMNARTPMVVVMSDGEVLRGVIEWYDRDCLKVNREGAPNLLVLKHAIKYLYKAEEEGGARARSDDSDA